MKYDFDDPGYSREQKVVSVYKGATGSNVQIFDNNIQPVDSDSAASIEQCICRYCTGIDPGNENAALQKNCRGIHADAIGKAGRSGRSHIYRCELGLMFWTGPIFREGKFSGALRGSGYVSDNANESEFAKKCNGTIPVNEFIRRIAALPTGDMEKINSLAEMLLLCTESVSTGREKTLSSKGQHVLG